MALTQSQRDTVESIRSEFGKYDYESRLKMYAVLQIFAQLKYPELVGKLSFEDAARRGDGAA